MRAQQMNVVAKTREMHLPSLPKELDFVKLGALAALLWIVLFGVGAFLAPSGYDQMTETEQWLDDLARNNEVGTASAVLTGLLGLLIVPIFAGVQAILRKQGEDYARVASLFAVLSAIFIALSSVMSATISADIAPRWAATSDEASRAALLSNTKILLALSYGLASVSLLVLGVALISASTVMLRLGRRRWTWLGWIGVAGGVASINGAFSGVEGIEGPVLLLPYGLLVVWILGVALGLLRSQGEPRAHKQPAEPKGHVQVRAGQRGDKS